MIKLYGVPPSPFVRKVQLAFAHRGIKYDLVATAPGSDAPEFSAASPLRKIPAIRTEQGHSFSDSSVIIAYYEKAQSQNALYPADLGDFATALFLEEFADTKLSEATAALYFQLVLATAIYGRDPDAARVEDLRANLVPAQLGVLEAMLPADGWLVAGSYSIADVAIGASLMNLWHSDFDIDAVAYPRSAAFQARFLAREDVMAQLELEKQSLAAIAASRR